MYSVFDIFSVGIGPSSSHTVGPMKAAKVFIDALRHSDTLKTVVRIEVELFGSLGQTGKGHGTGKAIVLGLMGFEPERIDINTIDALLAMVEQQQSIHLANTHPCAFSIAQHITFHRRKSLPKHANALELRAYSALGDHVSPILREVYYSIGGGTIVNDRHFEQERQQAIKGAEKQPFSFGSANELLHLCSTHALSIDRLMLANELATRTEEQIDARLHLLWQTMKDCVQRGLATEGILPGGLKVRRRAASLHSKLVAEQHTSKNPLLAMEWVNVFAMAVNEENAAGGRVVTAPTNGAAGILPAVLHYYEQFIGTVDTTILRRYFLTAAAIGILYKKNASISGAEVGCQGEVGVACSMAAGALAAILGGSPSQIECAAEIGMEHNLGLTCDPVGGLVQVPCIERNAMGAIKAINAAYLALRGTGDHKVSLDKVIKTMWQTGNDMKTKYKETARGGLAVNITEC